MKNRATFTGICKLTVEHEEGALKSTLLHVDFRIELSGNLDKRAYLKQGGLPTAEGSRVFTNIFVQALIGNIKHAHKEGFKDESEHLRYIIAELERGFVHNAEVREGTM